MREILTRIVERARGGVEVKVFGDKVILDEGALLSPFFFLLKVFVLTINLRVLKMSRVGHDVTSSSRSSLPTSR